MIWGVKNVLSCQYEHGIVRYSAKSTNFLSRESQERETCNCFGPKHKIAIC